MSGEEACVTVCLISQCADLKSAEPKQKRAGGERQPEWPTVANFIPSTPPFFRCLTFFTLLREYFTFTVKKTESELFPPSFWDGMKLSSL